MGGDTADALDNVNQLECGEVLRLSYGEFYQEDCVDFLRRIEDCSVTSIFADPPYNLKKEAWDNLGDDKDYLNWSIRWIEEAARILNPQGTLFICGYTEILADLKAPAMQYFDRCRWLIWYYDNKANMRDDWGRSHESILCLRKKDYIFESSLQSVG